MGDTYVIAWSDRELLCVINLSVSDRNNVIDILLDNPSKDWVSNPIRSLIVTAVSKKISEFELWEFSSDLSEEEITLQFYNSSTRFKENIRGNGVLIFSQE